LKYQACLSAPCMNDGTCYSDEDEDTFVCHCPQGFTGHDCSFAQVRHAMI